MSSGTPNIRIGFVGTGWSDRAQIPVFQKAGLIPQAICSGQLANAQRVAQKHGIPEVYATWQELIQSPTVDVVSVCSPPATHTEITVAALAAGKHIICEKPIRLTGVRRKRCLPLPRLPPIGWRSSITSCVLTLPASSCANWSRMALWAHRKSIWIDWAAND